MVACNSAAGNGKEVPEVVEATLYLESATFVTSETLHVDGGARRSLRPRRETMKGASVSRVT